MTVGIEDVARAAGVSPASVSRALSGGPVSAAVRERVERAVAETGYRPNLSARRLRSRHSRTIGLIVADICNPYFTAVSRAVEEVAYREGLRVILCNTDENPAKEELYLKLMEEERVTGVIFAPTRATAEKFPFEQQEFPVVLIDRVAPSRLCDAVLLDNRAATMTLVEHLHERGRRRIAGLFGAASTTGVERRDGYLAATERLGLPQLASMVDHAPGAAEAEVERLLALPTPPDALIASNGLMLMSTVLAVRAAGFTIPDRIAIAGFDNERWTELVEGGLTVIEQPVEEIGRTAMAILIERLRNPGAPKRKVVLAGKCIVRASSGTGALSLTRQA